MIDLYLCPLKMLANPLLRRYYYRNTLINVYFFVCSTFSKITIMQSS